MTKKLNHVSWKKKNIIPTQSVTLKNNYQDYFILTLSRVKLVLSKDFMEMGRVVISVKLVVLTAVGPPGLGTTKTIKLIYFRHNEISLATTIVPLPIKQYMVPRK